MKNTESLESKNWSSCGYGRRSLIRKEYNKVTCRRKAEGLLKGERSNGSDQKEFWEWTRE